MPKENDSHLSAAEPGRHTKFTKTRHDMAEGQTVVHKSKKHYGTAKAKPQYSEKMLHRRRGAKGVKDKKIAKHHAAVREGNLKAVKPKYH